MPFLFDVNHGPKLAAVNPSTLYAIPLVPSEL